MKVSYEIKHLNDLKGNGIFAKQKILKGEKIYALADDANKLEINDDQVEKFISRMSFEEKIDFFEHSFCFNDSIIVDLRKSEMKYMNHSLNPNSCVDTNGNSFATRDITPDEEITENYLSYSHPTQYERLENIYIGDLLNEITRK